MLYSLKWKKTILQNSVLNVGTARINIKTSAFCTYSVFVFHVCLTVNNNAKSVWEEINILYKVN